MVVAHRPNKSRSQKGRHTKSKSRHQRQRSQKAHMCRSQKAHMCRSTKCHHPRNMRGGNAFTDLFRSSSEPEILKKKVDEISDQSNKLRVLLHSLLSTLSDKAEQLNSKENITSSEEQKRVMDDFYHRIGSHTQAGLNELKKLNGHIASIHSINDAMQLQHDAPIKPIYKNLTPMQSADDNDGREDARGRRGEDARERQDAPPRNRSRPQR
jgi:hypothetical protein